MWKKAGLIDNNQVADSNTDAQTIEEWSRVLLHSSSYKRNGGDLQGKVKKKSTTSNFLKGVCVQAAEGWASSVCPLSHSVSYP